MIQVNHHLNYSSGVFSGYKETILSSKKPMFYFSLFVIDLWKLECLQELTPFYYCFV